MKVIFASGNRGKFNEAASAFAGIGVELLFGGDFESPLDISETGTTYEENALLKARAWACQFQMCAIADDSGLEVEALGGAPGIHSARIVPGSDADRITWLLDAMRGEENRRARFACSMVLASPNKPQPLSVLEYCCGHIINTPRGTCGFGYDPVFVPCGYDKTFAELDIAVKNKISHRAKAIAAMVQKMQRI